MNNISIEDRLKHGYFSPAEVSELLGVGMTKVFALLKTGQLRSCKIGKSRRIPGDAITAMMTQAAKAHCALEAWSLGLKDALQTALGLTIRYMIDDDRKAIGDWPVVVDVHVERDRPQ